MNGFLGNSTFGFLQVGGGGGGGGATTLADQYTILGDGSSLNKLRSSSAQKVYNNVTTLQEGNGIYIFGDTEDTFFEFNDDGGLAKSGQRVTIINNVFEPTGVPTNITLTGVGVVIKYQGTNIDVTEVGANNVFEFIYSTETNAWVLLNPNYLTLQQINLNNGDYDLIYTGIVRVNFDSESSYGSLHFPEPSNYIGQKIYIYNESNVDAPISTAISSRIPIFPDGSQINSLVTNIGDPYCYIFTAQSSSGNPRWVFTTGIIP